ncbi:MAG: DUF4258 domain-containing protein [Pseudonocardia sp.]
MRTWYTVEGGTVTQHVAPTAAHVYPIIADPFWIPLLAVFARFTAHALQRMAVKKISEDLVKQVILNGRSAPGNVAGTTRFSQGRGANQINVVVDNKSGNIITVTRGH